jgi:hypothetical protein
MAHPLGPANFAAQGARSRQLKVQVYARARIKFNIDGFTPPFRRIAKRRALTRLAGAPISAADLPRRGKGRQAVRFRAFVVAAASFARRL